MRESRSLGDAIGETVGGHYVLEEVLGRGGMAVVYRVRDTHTGKAVAMKRALAKTAAKHRQNEALLSREYHTLCQLAHPRIIEVYDYGVDEQGPYYLMELLEGSDLDASGKLPWREACALLCDVASSLAILHARGLVHRDVSARNVRRTPDGRAKLIDFGAMVSMGVPKTIVGTPPFMAPEVVQMQTLDGRADLYSLGALGYRLLTGRHAYHARRSRDLRDAWRTRPQAPARLCPDLPKTLSDLVMQLLALDRSARPQSAAEVMSRLCAIADLPLDEHVAVSHAYLTTPSLVGRDRALVAVRKRLLSLGRGDGGALLIEGEAGSGRSRLLDACAIEAKLLGAAVLRADAGDAQLPFGVVRALGNQLLRLMPKQAAQATRLSRDVLACVLDELHDEPSGPTSYVQPERDLLVRELRDFVLALARKQRLLIAVDDFDRIDEPSMAVLAALAYKAERHPLIVALTIDRESDFAASPAQRLLRSVCEPIVLEPLNEAQSEALVRSLFGDVPNLQLVAARIHALAQGSPRATIELAQHLVTTGSVRYRLGGFALPEGLSESELPATFLASLQQRLARVSGDARELCEILCIGDGDALTVASYVRLTDHGDSRRVFSAIDELVAARVLVADGDRYRFGQRGFFSAVGAAIAPSRAATLHARAADWVADTGGDVLRRAHHLLRCGGDGDLEAIALIAHSDFTRDHAPLALLELAIARAEHHRLDVRTIQRLRTVLLLEAQGLLDVAYFQANARPLLEQLERDGGLALYRSLSHLPQDQRLSQALAGTHERHLATPERERGYAITEAIPELGKLMMLFHAIGIASFDIRTWEPLPSLGPLVQLSPALEVVERFGQASRAWVEGRFLRSVTIYRELLARCEQPDRAGMPEASHARIVVGLHLLLGLRCAATGSEEGETHAQVLDRDRLMRVSAWRVRQVMHLSRGDVEEARRCMRRAEALQVQVGGEQHALGSTFAIELMTFALMGDLLGLRMATERIAGLVERQPGWRPVFVYGQVRLRQLQGDAAGALEQLLAALPLVPPGRHWCFGLFATCHVALLTELGRVEEACAVGGDYMAVCEREELMAGLGHQLGLALSLALAQGGLHDRAVALAERMIADLRADNWHGVLLGVAYETRARIALAAKDAEAFDEFAQLCGREWGSGKNPVLATRFAKLLDDARAATIASLIPAPQLQALSTDASESEYTTIYSRMQECADAPDRARCALSILLQHVESFAGYLYGVHENGLRLLAGLPEAAPPPELDDWLRRWTEGELAAVAGDVATTGDGDHDGPAVDAPVPSRFVDGEGRRFAAILVFNSAQTDMRLCAVLVMQVERSDHAPWDRELGARIAMQLLEHGDVAGIPLEEARTLSENG